MNDSRYQKYFAVDKEEKQITLNCNFKKTAKNKQRFVTLTGEELDFLIEKNDKLLTKYLLYLKYFCGYSKSKKIDSTAKQILTALGYSAASGKLISSLSSYNSLLVSKGFITIEKYRDPNGRERNLYRTADLKACL